MRPVRKSSEGPEVVQSPQLQSPDKYLVAFSDRFERPSTIFQQKLSEEPKQKQQLTYIPPSGHYSSPTHDLSEARSQARPFGLLSILILSLFTFLVGGGIGGGVGGVIAAKNQDKISRYTHHLQTI